MNIEALNTYCENSFVAYLGIEFTSYDGESIQGKIEIREHHLQPVGVVHGGLYISFAETLAGAGSSLMVQEEGKTAFGTAINSQHLAPVTKGSIKGRAKLIFKGAFKHIWDVEIYDENSKLISISRVTNSIKEVKQQQSGDE